MLRNAKLSEKILDASSLNLETWERHAYKFEGAAY